ncbi:MAG: tyrosine-type recombinase/integrase [Candidatus Peribacteraceae bacterium]|nr:tyrosine-type recombinase/integrase [Candidatus Peribacteraceae bacterium]
MHSVITTSTAQPKDLVPFDLFLRNQSCVATRRTYSGELRQFISFMNKRAKDITFGDMLDYKAHLENSGLQSVTIVKKLRAISSLFKFLYEQKAIDHNPMSGLKLPKIRQQTVSKDILSLVESNRLISSIDTSTLKGKRDKAMVSLALINALRCIELCRANIGDLSRRDDCWVMRVHGKCNKEADVRIRDDVYAAIKDYLEARGELAADAPLFIGMNHRSGKRMSTRAVQFMVRDRLKDIGADRPSICVHTLRHSSLSQMIRAGADLLDCQTLARHSSPSTTMVYITRENVIKNHPVLLNPIKVS